ncbi:MAG: hypothetical protein Q9166_004931 [cf. Caloplaca sp. 2 TL-2023]
MAMKSDYIDPFIFGLRKFFESQEMVGNNRNEIEFNRITAREAAYNEMKEAIKKARMEVCLVQSSTRSEADRDVQLMGTPEDISYNYANCVKKFALANQLDEPKYFGSHIRHVLTSKPLDPDLEPSQVRLLDPKPPITTAAIPGPAPVTTESSANQPSVVEGTQAFQFPGLSKIPVGLQAAFQKASTNLSADQARLPKRRDTSNCCPCALLGHKCPWKAEGGCQYIDEVCAKMVGF